MELRAIAAEIEEARRGPRFIRLSRGGEGRSTAVGRRRSSQEPILDGGARGVFGWTERISDAAKALLAWHIKRVTDQAATTSGDDE